jgi:Trm5-related predicted tRNA methylase
MTDILTGVNVVIVVYALVIERLEKAAARTQAWRGQRYRLAEETRRNLDTVAALEKGDLNNNAL